jgi:poly(ribitol-phosphate) beta-N-acetylglucosaminyltransferase
VVKISVIVPVYNPGPNIDRCISSLLEQSLPADEYEVVFVDDGSTDETPGRLDELARNHPNVRVEHTPNSGWPGRPRNIGLDLARGDFVYFVDNDDWLGDRALERLYDAAVRYESDVVVGKVVGHGRLVTRALFVRNRRETSVEWRPLLSLLTPHKLFRRSLLDDHGIRFPEGRRRLEDHMFVMHAYFHARRISVLATYPCYHWMRSPEDVNASWRQFDPVSYFENVREVLDLVDRHTEPGPLRDQMRAAWYRGKMLERVGGDSFLRREPEYRRQIYDEIRRLALERYGPEIDARLPFNLRVRARLLRQGRYDALGALAQFESALRADVTVRRVAGAADKLTIEVEAALGSNGEPLVLARRGARIDWVPPETFRQVLPQQTIDVTGELEKARVQIVLRSRRDESEYVVPTASATVLVRAAGEDEARRPVLVAVADLDRARAAAGSRLAVGEWDVLVLVEVAGFMASTSTVRQPGRLRYRSGPLTLIATWDGRLLPRPPLRRRIAHRFPKLAGLAQRIRPRRRGGAAAAGRTDARATV